MRSADLRAMIEGVRPGDGSILRLADVERGVIPLLVELWEAAEGFTECGACEKYKSAAPCRRCRIAVVAAKLADYNEGAAK